MALNRFPDLVSLTSCQGTGKDPATADFDTGWSLTRVTFTAHPTKRVVVGNYPFSVEGVSTPVDELGITHRWMPMWQRRPDPGACQ